MDLNTVVRVPTAKFVFLYKRNLGEKKFFDSDDVYYIKYNNDYFGLKPYVVVLVSEPDREVNVGFNVAEYTLNFDENKYEKKTHFKDSDKGFRLPTILIQEIVNCEAAICEQIKDMPPSQITRGAFEVQYFIDKPYLRLNNINEKFMEYIKSFAKLPVDFDVASLGQSVIRANMMKGLHKELSEAMIVNERAIQVVFTKYSVILSAVLLGIDSTLDFEFRIDESEDLEENRADISSSEDNKPRNLIELKGAGQELFKKNRKYRNNTFGLTSEFSNAIQQANIQRAHLSATSSDKLDSLSKSILIIGNCKNEFDESKYKDELYYNLSVVRYNNKDITIMTYDQVLDRIDLLSNM